MSDKDKMSFTGILVQTVMRWKIILLCAIIGFAGMAFKSYTGQSSEVEAGSDAKDGYEISDVDKISVNVTDSISARINYLKNSYIVSLKSGESYEASAVLYVSDGSGNEYTLFNDAKDKTSMTTSAVNTKTGAILSALEQFINTKVDYASLYDAFDMDEDLYFRDLVDCSVQGSSLVLSTIADKAELADSLMNTLVDQVESKFDHIAEEMQLDGYDVVAVSNEPAVKVYPQEFPTLKKVNDELRELVAMQQTLTDSQADLAKRAVPVREAISKKEMVKSGVKGGILGFGGSAVIIIVYLIAKGKLLSAKEVEEGLDLKTIAVLMPKYGKKELKGLNKKIIGIDPLYRNLPTVENSLALADDYLIQKSVKNVAVVCDVEKRDDTEKIVNGLNALKSGIVYQLVVRPNEDLSERRKLQDVDGVVMLGIVGISKLEDIENLKALMNDYDKPVYGCVVM